ncbi:DHA2 family efflux MFS transporter permease subunit [Streptomyces sp. R41]|uniref:DHA2 family efflux MFS transporter permease subunit n=1 Tax=Streptomyces sp. R41 TaxID=3238632 RepID=A0AB39R707_9ACTN
MHSLHTGTPGPVFGLPLLAVCLGYFMVILDATVVTVALPVIGDSLGASVAGLQWVADGYTLVFAGLLLFSGGLADRLGGRRVFLAGLAVFTLGSAGCAAAPDTALLVAARLVQGLGAALLVPASLSVLNILYTDRAARARAFGVWGAVAGVGAGAGPVLGGALTAWLGWRSVFLLNLPVGALACVLTVRCVPTRSRAAQRRGGLDLPAQTAAAVGLAGLVTALIEAGERGWADRAVLGAWVVCAAGFLTFLVLEARSRAPMLPLSLFRRADLSASVGVGGLLNLGFYGLLFLAPLYFQRVQHYGPLRTGAALLPAVCVVALGSALAGPVTARTGPRVPMVIGLTVGAAGLLGWLAAGTGTAYAALVVPMVSVGFGTAFTMPAATAAAMEAVPETRGGAASAVLNAARQTGSAVGVALFGTLIAAHLVVGLHRSVVVAAAGFLTAAALAATFVRPTARSANSGQ